MTAAPTSAPTGTPRAEPLARRAIPSSGETVPVVGLGTWRVLDVGAGERAALRPLLVRFAELGATVVDSSPMYGQAEETVGELVAALGVRERLFLATKVWTTGRAAGVAEMERSLRRLRTERIDLMQVHNLLDAAIHLDTLAGWKREGRVRYVGVTHYLDSAHDELGAWIRRGGLDFVQVNYSIVERGAERRLLPLARDAGVAVVANRPFASGAAFARLRERPLPAWLGERGVASWAQAMLLWTLAHPAVTCVIPATSKPRHLEENVRAGALPIPGADERERLGGELERALG